MKTSCPCICFTVNLHLFRDETKLKMTFNLRVSSEKCPDPLENISIPQEVNGGLPCKQEEIFKLNSTKNIRWMKVSTAPWYSCSLSMFFTCTLSRHHVMKELVSIKYIIQLIKILYEKGDRRDQTG